MGQARPHTIRREIAKRTKQLIVSGMKSGAALNKARQEANIKHGDDWRSREERDYKSRNNRKISDDFPTGYEDHPFGEHWMD